MSVVRDIMRTYRAPREVQARRMSGAPREDRALAVLMGACVLIFVAQWPRLSREAFLDPSIGFDARLAGALFGWIMVMPLVFYALAVITQLILRAFGTAGAGYASRMSLFWALLASTPLWLLTGLTAGFVGPGAGLTITGIAALGAFVIFWMAGLSVVLMQRNEGRA
ncbi:MAG: YIP1 family protein [Silicimonas sp.]|nr:YIP1 family protein [Silicimonas sp.]